ncbi:hypothetical protein GGF43_004464, partial [Coemansia sp. RSA 2618]
MHTPTPAKKRSLARVHRLVLILKCMAAGYMKLSGVHEKAPMIAIKLSSCAAPNMAIMATTS